MQRLPFEYLRMWQMRKVYHWKVHKYNEMRPLNEFKLGRVPDVPDKACICAKCGSARASVSGLLFIALMVAITFDNLHRPIYSVGCNETDRNPVNISAYYRTTLFKPNAGSNRDCRDFPFSFIALWFIAYAIQIFYGRLYRRVLLIVNSIAQD